MYLKKKRLGSVIPREEDLHGAAQALIRLQDVYELDIRDLSKGDLGRNRQRQVTKARLSAQDCLFMGKHCFNSGSLARSLEWFEEAWIMAGIVDIIYTHFLVFWKNSCQNLELKLTGLILMVLNYIILKKQHFCKMEIFIIFRTVVHS